jgi:hypothetical protein
MLVALDVSYDETEDPALAAAVVFADWQDATPRAEHRVWQITVHLLQDDGSYQARDTSACFPWLPMAEMTTWLARGYSWQEGENSFIRAFRQWIGQLA